MNFSLSFFKIYPYDEDPLANHLGKAEKKKMVAKAAVNLCSSSKIFENTTVGVTAEIPITIPSGIVPSF